MKKLYLVTGAGGFVGTEILRILEERRDQGESFDVRALSLPQEADLVPAWVQLAVGDLRDPESLRTFLDRSGYDQACLVHLASIITISSKPDPLVRQVNVEGSRSLLKVAKQEGVDRVLFISSVHAIPESPGTDPIKEVSSYGPDRVHGQYGKTKAEAAQLALDFASQGMDLTILNPSGVFGPLQPGRKNPMYSTIRRIWQGAFPTYIPGGYDFVDVRDLAQGILLAEEGGRTGESYILSGHYLSFRDLQDMVADLGPHPAPRFQVPMGLMKFLAHPVEWGWELFSSSPALMTPYAVSILDSNGHFSSEKARRDFNYQVRPVKETLEDIVDQVRKEEEKKD